MSSLGISACGAFVLSLAAAGLSGCGGEDDGGSGTAGSSGSGGSSGGAVAGSGGSAHSAGTTSTAGKGGTSAGSAGRPPMSSGGSGGATGGKGGSSSSNGGTGDAAGRPTSSNGKSPYEIECHGETVMCGDPTSLLCLGLRVEEQVFGYACSNECTSDANCATEPSSTDASPACVDFVNKKYCMLVCEDDDELSSCPNGMYCYSYPGATIGYCLWE
jgi:hypothetical protein